MNPGTKVKVIDGEYKDLIGKEATIVDSGYSDYPTIRVKTLFRGSLIEYNQGMDIENLKRI